MPPVAKAGGQQFRKDVEFVATKASDEYELEATGIVMVPDKADLQNDFAREGTIRGFAEQFSAFEDAGQAGGGIMHAVWPDGWMALERNEVLDEAEDINGTTADAGAWVQRWGIDNAQLAALIDDGVLEGYSIGAIQVDWDGPFEQGEADDVDTSAVPDDELVWELTDGIVREVSAVDIPAVPDAQILEAKADAEKRLAEHVGNPEAFVDEAMQRGHTEAEAERLWDVLNDAMEADGASDPGKTSYLERLGKTVVDAVFGTGDDTAVKTFPDDAPIPDDIETFGECEAWAEDQEDIDDPEAFCGEYWEPEESAAAKAGRTLSKRNRESAMAAIDANLDMLEDSGMDHGLTRFTDREDVAFDLSEHSARVWADDEDDGDEDEDEGEGEDEVEDSAETESDAKDAPDGDTSDDNTNMSDDDPGEDPDEKTLAEQNAEQISELTQAVDSLADQLADDGEEKTAQIEIDGEVYEVSESEVKGWFESDGEDPMAEAPTHVKALAEKVEQVNERLDAINRQSGTSTQLNRGSGENEEKESGLDELGSMLS